MREMGYIFPGNDAFPVRKKIALYIMAALYILAGINHLIHPQFYHKIMPPWLPWHHKLIITSGLLEVIFGCLLLLPSTRALGAWGIIILLILIFPANVHMMQDYRHTHHPLAWITIVRLPLQAVLIWWAYLFTKKP